MPLQADLSVKLNASSLVQGFLTQVTSSSGTLTAIAIPADPQRFAQASAAGGAFVPTPIFDAVSRFGATTLPTIQLPATIERIEATLSSIEELTTRDLAFEVNALAQQITTELERANAQGIPGTLLAVADLLKGSPTSSALGSLLSTFLGDQRGLLPEGLSDFLPAFANTIRVLAGLMVYETVLADGERFTAIVKSLFSAERARQHADGLLHALQFGATPLAQALSTADPTDSDRVDGLIVALDNAAAQLAELNDYVAEGMGFGEATLVHFDVNAAQAQIGIAGALLRDPDLGSLRRVMESVARQADPITNLLDPGTAAARSMEEVLQLAEAQAEQAANAIRNLDASVLVKPLTQGITALTAPLRDFSNLVTQVVTEVRAALEQVRAAVAALPIDDLATAIRTALEPVTQALQLVQQLVDEIRAALQAAAQAATTALGTVEQNVDAFQQQVTALFEDARQFVDGLHLEQVVGSISDQVNEFVGLLQQAQLKPYFDTASSAIDTAADLIEEVPLELLPESMKSDLDTALAPVREADPQAVANEIKSLLQLGPNGEFELRDELELTLAGIQAKFDQLLAMLDEHHPSKYVQQLDERLSALAAQIQALSPQLSLEPVQQAIAHVKSALGSFDLQRELQPVQAVFDSAIQALDEYSPAQLLQPLQQRVVEARQKLEAAIRINEWRPQLDELAATALRQLDVLDPTALEALLKRLLDQVRLEIDNVPDFSFGKWLGAIVAGLMRGSNLRIGPSSICAVLAWASGTASASTELSGRATRIAEAIAATLREVQAFEPAGLTVQIGGADAVRTAARSLAAKLAAGSNQRFRLEAGANRLEAGVVFGALAANRARYLAVLQTAAGLGDGLRRTGMSEADVAVQQLRDAFAPLQPLMAKVRQLGAYLGLGGAQTGFSSILRRVLSVATPERLTALFTRLITALRDRLKTLIDQVLAPVRAAIDDLKRLIAAFDLKPIIDSIQSIFEEVKTQLLAYSPNVLLADQLTAFANLKQTLLAFDPIGAIVSILNNLRDTAARILKKLSAQKLLESPIAIYDTILNAIRQLNISTLLAPVLDALDSIAQQVDQGLDETVDAFKRLQDALPPPGGGSSVSVSVSVV